MIRHEIGLTRVTRSGCNGSALSLRIGTQCAKFCAAVLTAVFLKAMLALGAGVALVLAIDVSASVTADSYVLQHDGIARAFENPRLIDAVSAAIRPGACKSPFLEDRFARDSPLEESGFEPSVPLLREGAAKRSYRGAVASRARTAADSSCWWTGDAPPTPGRTVGIRRHLRARLLGAGLARSPAFVLLQGEAGKP